jgi:hypothetical protein
MKSTESALLAQGRRSTGAQLLEMSYMTVVIEYQRHEKNGIQRELTTVALPSERSLCTDISWTLNDPAKQLQGNYSLRHPHQNNIWS